MVLGAAMHKGSPTLGAVAVATGELLGDRTVEVGDREFAAALDWARGQRRSPSAVRICVSGYRDDSWVLLDLRDVAAPPVVGR